MDGFSTLPGPDFLDAVAQAEEHLCNRINADAFEVYAKRWQRDLDRIAELETQIECLQVAQRARPAPLPRHALTPSDRRN